VILRRFSGTARTSVTLNMINKEILMTEEKRLPITVAALSKVYNVFAYPNSWILGSNPTQVMDVCVRLFCVCVVLC
jgi:hypothetical protein